MSNERSPEIFNSRRWRILAAAMVLFAGVSTLSCSFKQIAINKLGDAVSKEGTTYGSDDDPELIKGAVPFGLKLMESLLLESPRHK